MEEKKYEKAFISKLIDCSSEAAEVQVWIDMSFDCGYINKDKHKVFSEKYDEVNKMLYAMVNHPEKFCF